MKRILILTLFLLITIQPISAFATAIPKNTVKYFEIRDEYVVTYNRGFSRPPVSIKLIFDSSTGTHAEKQFDSTGITGVFYLSCNGNYRLEFYDGSGLVGHIPNLVTTNIKSNRCESYPYVIHNDLNAKLVNAGAGVLEITWPRKTEPLAYEFYRDGAFLELKWNDTPYTIYYPTEPGMYTINAVGPDGHSMGTSDVLVTEPMINNTGSTTNPWGSGAADDINGGGLLPGETPGGGDPGGGGGTPTESCDGCQIINDMLDCPEWDTYMGEWSKMIKNSVPPAPDWQQVANVMRDTIVPAIGNELLNKMPQYADIIADELQSREKAVSAPGQLPTFNPAVPTMTDLPSKFEQSVTDNVPSFEPDFSGSQPFVIPDPMTALDMSTDDKQGGYQHNPNPDRTAPTYTKTEAEPEPDIGYKEMPEVTVTPPAYQNRNTNSSTPAPGYKQANPTAAEPNRSYQITNSAPMPTYTDTNATSGSPMPAYRTKQ